jgi:chitin synthase
MLVGWMVVYLLSYVPFQSAGRFRMSHLSHRYPVYSFFLPVYSFWCMDEFGWGNTRLVIGEGGSKKILVNEDEKFDDSMIPLKKFSGKNSSQSFRAYTKTSSSRVRS